MGSGQWFAFKSLVIMIGDIANEMAQKSQTRRTEWT